MSLFETDYGQFGIRINPNPEALARVTDPVTSHQAARSISKESKAACARDVLAILREGPKTDEQLVERAAEMGLPWSPSGLRSRRNELVPFAVVQVGEARTKSNRRAAVWGAIERREV